MLLSCFYVAVASWQAAYVCDASTQIKLVQKVAASDLRPAVRVFQRNTRQLNLSD